MKKLSALALVAALAITAPAFALDLKAGADGALDAGAQVGSSAVGAAADAGVKAGTKLNAAGASVGADVDATATGSVGQPNFGTLISTLNAGKSTVDLSAITADADITVVNVSTLKAEGDPAALDNALEKNADALTTLHADINANTDLKAKLETQGVTIDDVVAVTTEADGKLTVFVDDRA